MIVRWKTLFKSRNGLSTSYPSKVFLWFMPIYLLLMYFARETYYRDPTSIFFDPERGYLPNYSRVRSEQADAFIEQVNSFTVVPTKSSGDASLCVGFATVARDGPQYVKTAVGSVLEGLSESERASMHLILLIAHSDPSQHPAYSEEWLHRVADTVLLYDDTKDDMSRIVEWEKQQNKAMAREKGLYDYKYLLQACYATNTSNVAILEDDVIALDGWLHRTRDALSKAEQQTRQLGRSTCELSPRFYDPN
jgi:hypothetical protein